VIQWNVDNLITEVSKRIKTEIFSAKSKFRRAKIKTQIIGEEKNVFPII